MILKELKINTWIGDSTNCYILFDEESKEVMVIDPAGEVEKIEELIQIMGGKLKYIYLTHCHGDHILGVMPLKERCGGKILIHREDREGLNDPQINLSPYIGLGEIELEADSRIDDGDNIHLGNLLFQVLHTPGHTKGSTSLYCEKEGCLFSGDTIFRGTWGRTDLPTSDREAIMKAIVEKIMVLPEDTILYPRTWDDDKDQRGKTNLFRIKTKAILRMR